MLRSNWCLGIVLTGCFSSGERPAHGVHGRVIDSGSLEPVFGADVTTSRAGDESDENGRFHLDVVVSGPIWVRATHLWYRPDSVLIEDSASARDPIQVILTPLPRACCQLRGSWQLTLWADTAGGQGTFNPGPASGEVAFAPRYRALFPDEFTTRYDNAGSPYEPGRYTLDEGAIWPWRVLSSEELEWRRKSWGRPAFNAWRREQQTAIGFVYYGDSVTIGLGPLGSHSGYWLYGRVYGDSILGTWGEAVQQGPSAEGHFLMIRSRS
jgi:hypothetical protein